MNPARVLRALGPIDLRGVARDPLLRWMAVMPIALALVLRWLAPVAVARVSTLLEFDLGPYWRPLLAGYLVLFAPLLAGWVIGFLLLDQRDDRTLSALVVTPLTLRGYLAYRLAVPTALAVVQTLVVLPLAGVADGGALPLVLAALTGAPLAPISALCLAVFASNKVEGFALMKASGILVLPPFIAWFVDEPWRLLFGIAPTYWAPAVYWNALDGAGYMLEAVGGVVYGALCLMLLVRRFERLVPR